MGESATGDGAGDEDVDDGVDDLVGARAGVDGLRDDVEFAVGGTGEDGEEDFDAVGVKAVDVPRGCSRRHGRSPRCSRRRSRVRQRRSERRARCAPVGARCSRGRSRSVGSPLALVPEEIVHVSTVHEYGTHHRRWQRQAANSQLGQGTSAWGGAGRRCQGAGPESVGRLGEDIPDTPMARNRRSGPSDEDQAEGSA